MYDDIVTDCLKFDAVKFKNIILSIISDISSIIIVFSALPNFFMVCYLFPIYINLIL